MLPGSAQPPEKTLLRRGGPVNLPVLNQEHPLTRDVTSEIIQFGNITTKILFLALLFQFWTRGYYGPEVVTYPESKTCEKTGPGPETLAFSK